MKERILLLLSEIESTNRRQARLYEKLDPALKFLECWALRMTSSSIAYPPAK